MPFNKEKNMLTWYYDTAKYSDFLDAFRSFDDLGTKTSRKLKYEIDEEGIKVEMPGVNSSNLDIKVEGKTLKISGKSRHNQEFTYSYSLSSNIDVEGITASLQDGLLDVKLPKRPDTPTRKIPISS